MDGQLIATIISSSLVVGGAISGGFWRLGQAIGHLEGKVEGLDRRMQGYEKQLEGFDKRVDRLDRRIQRPYHPARRITSEIRHNQGNR